ncbi:MAG TPA: hypothetical protein VFI71_04575, partial [Pyrinomonadaceae bacterium]|nr:hypothetical protein [Pyrinomonadaceae bacterium]
GGRHHDRSVDNHVLHRTTDRTDRPPLLAIITPKALANFSPAIGATLLAIITPKALANLSPAVGAQRQPWDHVIYFDDQP